MSQKDEGRNVISLVLWLSFPMLALLISRGSSGSAQSRWGDAAQAVILIPALMFSVWRVSVRARRYSSAVTMALIATSLILCTGASIGIVLAAL